MQPPRLLADGDLIAAGVAARTPEGKGGRRQIPSAPTQEVGGVQFGKVTAFPTEYGYGYAVPAMVGEQVYPFVPHSGPPAAHRHWHFVHATFQSPVMIALGGVERKEWPLDGSTGRRG